MRITGINYSKTFSPQNCPNFTSKVTTVLYGDANDDLKKQIDVFEETHKNATLLGSGLFSKVFKLDGQDVVIKESLPTRNARKINGNFKKEAKALKLVPDYLNNSQKLIADVETQRGNYYLISTLVQGKKPTLTNVWEKKHFDSLFDTLFELDKANLLHNDLNRGNCLISDDGKVGIIDYQWAEPFYLSDKGTDQGKNRFPGFMAHSNAQMFEMANLPFYLSKFKAKNDTEKMREIFVTYLNSKSDYCQKRADYLKEHKSSMNLDNYDRLQAKFLKNPSDDVIELEALKLQILYGYRQLFSIVDPNNPHDGVDMLTAVPTCLYVANCGKELKELADKLSLETDDEDYKDFLHYEGEIGRIWKNWMLDDVSGDFGMYKWIVRNANLSPNCPEDDIRRKIEASSKKDFKKVDDIFHAIAQKEENKTGEKYHSKSNTVKYNLHFTDKTIKETNTFDTLSDNDKKDKQVMEVEEARNDFVKSFNETYYAIKDGRIYACLPAAIKTLYLANILKNKAVDMYCNTEGEKRKYAEDQTDLGQESVSMVSGMLDSLFREARDSVSSTSTRKAFRDASNSVKLNDFNVKDCPDYSYDQDIMLDF